MTSARADWFSMKFQAFDRSPSCVLRVLLLRTVQCIICLYLSLIHIFCDHSDKPEGFADLCPFFLIYFVFFYNFIFAFYHNDTLRSFGKLLINSYLCLVRRPFSQFQINIFPVTSLSFSQSIYKNMADHRTRAIRR